MQGDGLYIRMDKNGDNDTSGDFILLGSYPQSRVTDDGIVAALNCLTGKLPTNGDNGIWTSYKYYIFDDNDVDFMWYVDIERDDGKYRGVYFVDYRPNNTMNMSNENWQERNGYISERAYWFKYEPIVWKILEEKGNKVWLIADKCIDSQAYRNIVWENSYVKSSIRKWLNEEFMNFAFNEGEKSMISQEIVVNIMEDVDVCDGDKPGSDTLDYIHLLSYDEAVDKIAQGQRKGVATDYAKCQGIYVSQSNGKSVWWLRTPYYSIESWAQVVGVHDTCDFATSEIDGTDIGIRPALWLKI